MDKKIVIYPDPLLLSISQPVPEIDQAIQDLLKEMAIIMAANNAIGLAAPQIGILQRLIVVQVDGPLYQVVNPQISWRNGQQPGVEGCLSIKDETYEVNRAQEIVIQGLNPEGKEISVLANDLLARVFQHEVDHLDGILINSKGKLVEWNQ